MSQRHMSLRPATFFRLLTRLRSAGAGDDGMSTAEYAIGTIAAAAFAAVLYAVVTGDSVADGVKSLVEHALSVVT
jgi:hypothetical protein